MSLVDGSPIKPQLCVHEVRASLGRDDIAISDVGAHSLWMMDQYPAYRPNTLICSEGLYPMGVGIPWAIAAKLTSPDKKVVTVVGDGGLAMTACEIETAKRLGLSFVIVVMRDDGYGLIRLKEERSFGRSAGVDFDNPDLVRFAGSYGIKGYAVSSAAELGEVIRSSLKNDELALIDVPIDRAENRKLKIG